MSTCALAMAKALSTGTHSSQFVSGYFFLNCNIVFFVYLFGLGALNFLCSSRCQKVSPIDSKFKSGTYAVFCLCEL